jgi:hypothetical protein
MYPTIPARTAADTVCAIRSGESEFGSRSFNSMTAAPLMAGTAIKRLNPTAQDREKPIARAIATVNALRLTPGSGASA